MQTLELDCLGLTPSSSSVRSTRFLQRWNGESRQLELLQALEGVDRKQ